MIGIIGAARTHQDVRTSFDGVFVSDFGLRIGQSKNNWALGHRANHIFGKNIAFGKADKDICALNSLCQGVYIAAGGGKFLLLLSQICAIVSDNAFRVEHNNVLFARTKSTIQARTRDCRRASAIYDDFNLFYFFISHDEGIQKSGAGNDSCAVLVIMHYRNVQFFLQAALDFKTFGRFNVFKVNATKRWGNGFHGLNEFLRIFLVYFYVESVDTCVDFEQKALPLHHGLTGHRADVAQAEHGCTIGNHSYEIAFVSVFINVVGFILNFQTRLCNARRIGQRKIGLRPVRLSRDNFYLSRLPHRVVAKCCLFSYLYHFPIAFICEDIS